MFTLNTLIDLYLSKRRKLYSCFVDYSKAFDTVSRAALWSKLLNSNVCGKIFIIIVNMYKSVRSCVAANGLLSDIFSCLMGVRQGENLSPLLFSLFLNDLHSFLQSSQVNLQILLVM